MKVTRSFIIRLVLAVLFTVGIVFAFRQFRAENKSRIARQNEEYIGELTLQGVKSLDNLMAENLGFLKSTAYLYGKSLVSPWADVAVIRDYDENSVFDTLCFIDASGDAYTSRGVMANVADRRYFRAGMRGESGVAFIPDSRFTDGRQLCFYSPVYYEGEVIGVMAGYYGEDYIRSILEYSLFGYEGDSWLCTGGGNVIGSTRTDSPVNYPDSLEKEGRCSAEELQRLREALAGKRSITFTFLENGEETLAYGIPLTQMPWMLVRNFPPSASKMLLDTTNMAGEKLSVILIALFLVFAVVIAVSLIIQLVQNKKTIKSTERDPLTGLYNSQYFFHYVEKLDQHHKSTDMDAVMIDVDNFRMVNERYGRAHGDDVLRRIGQRLLDSFGTPGGVICRRGGDVFMIYCPHRENYEDVVDLVSVKIKEDEDDDNRVRLRIGIYANADKELEAVRRFDKAKAAVDTIRGNFNRQIAYYDDVLHRKELYESQLIGDFNEAIRSEQFLVYLQPKFDIRGGVPFPSGAEALVRWQHPRLGLLSPFSFIPLFEANGLIQQLDMYVWEHAAMIIRDWKSRFGKCLPVSINISRVDMYDPGLTAFLASLIEKYGLTTDELLLEITESAYMDDSVHIIDTARRLRELGFKIEMDDFGTGYSSLNMINDLPIDVLKLDMAFVRNAFKNGRNTRLLEIIIDIARYLSVPVIAEGVETLEQLDALKSMGCDYVQGYYFSMPVPAEEFEKYLK